MSQGQEPHCESILVADCGSNTTRVVLIEIVDRAYRFLARGEAPSTLEAPFNDVTVGVLNAIASIQAATGHVLLLNGRLLVPQQEDGAGVDAFIACSSAAEPLRVVAAGLVHNLSAESARRASYATYTNVLDTISLDDPGQLENSQNASEALLDPRDPAAEFSVFTSGKDRPAILKAVPENNPKNKKLGRASRNQNAKFNNFTWRERQIAKLRRLAPNVVVVAGGVEDGPAGALPEIIEIFLEVERQEALLSNVKREEHYPVTMIYAGNKAGLELLEEKNQDQLEIFATDNIRPAVEIENLKPVQNQLAALYQERFLPGLPGYSRLRDMSSAPVKTTCESVGLMTRFLAKDVPGNQVLAADLGGGSSALFYAEEDRFSSLVRGGLGLSYGLSNLLAETSTVRLRNWLPFEIGDDELIHYALNKVLRPQVLPADEREKWIEGAFAREALHVLGCQLQEQAGGRELEFNRLIGLGSALVNISPWQAALTLLDGLQPGGGAKTGLLELELDSTMLMAACGTLASFNANAAAYVFRYDCLHRLGTVIVPLGEGVLGNPAVSVKLLMVDGQVKETNVAFGEIAIVPLRSDEKAQLEVQPYGHLRIGRAHPGSLVRTAAGQELSGGGLGLIIDARGRPLQFSAEPAVRREQVLGWANVYHLALEQAEREQIRAFEELLANPIIDDQSPEFVTSGGTPLKQEPKVKSRKAAKLERERLKAESLKVKEKAEKLKIKNKADALKSKVRPETGDWSDNLRAPRKK